MRRPKHWSLIPFFILGALVVIVVIALAIFKPMNGRGQSRLGALTSSAPGERKPGTKADWKALSAKIEQLPDESQDRELLISLFNDVNALSAPGEGAVLSDFQAFQSQLSEVLTRLEENVDNIVDPSHQDILDDLKDEVLNRQIKAWKRQVGLIDERIADLPQSSQLRKEVRQLKGYIADIDVATEDMKGGDIKAIRKRLSASGRDLSDYRPTLAQVDGLIIRIPSSPNLLMAMGIAILALLLNLVSAFVFLRVINELRRRSNELSLIPNDLRNLRDSVANETKRIDQLEIEMQRIPRGPLPSGGQRRQIESRDLSNSPEWERPRSLDDAPHPRGGQLADAPVLSPVPTTNGFIGKISDLQALIPSPNRVMQYDHVSGLLLEGASGPKYRVFQDPTNQEFRVLPMVERAHMQQQLYALEPLFDLEGPGSGAVALMKHPQLQASESGYRIIAKGRLRIG